MQSRENQMARVLAQEDQAWAEWDEHLIEIERLIYQHPVSERDFQILRACACLVAGRLRVLRAARDEHDGAPPDAAR